MSQGFLSVGERRALLKTAVRLAEEHGGIHRGGPHEKEYAALTVLMRQALHETFRSYTASHIPRPRVGKKIRELIYAFLPKETG